MHRRKSRVNALRRESKFELVERPPPKYDEADVQQESEPDDENNPSVAEDNEIDVVQSSDLKKGRGLSLGAADLADRFSNVVNLRKHVQKWAECVPAKRKIGIKKDGSGTIDVTTDRFVPVSGSAAPLQANKCIGYVKLNEMGICELGSDVEEELVPVDATNLVEREKAKRHNASVTQSQALLHYFAKLARSDDVEEEIDMNFVDSLINAGADVNTRDVFGQSLLHEVARAWHVSVAEYLVDKGADINCRDYLGRTPLHVAAAVDYPDMIEVLLENGAVLETLTFEENQTPLHFAARNDASNALMKLVKCRANLEATDYKDRTPLFVAAELDRSDTARLLLEYGANAGVVDKSGMSCIVLMARKMSPVAKEALDQFHKKDRANRKQMFYLEKLEHVKPDQEDVAAQSVLQVVVDFNKLDLIMHPIFEKLIEVKWSRFGLKGALFQLSINILFVASWTVQALAEPTDAWKYDLPSDIWRIALYGVSVTLWLYQFVNEIFELRDSKKNFNRWYKWRKEELEKDFKYVHQRWPEEESYLRLELQSLQDQEPSYFYDLWNWFDWITYFILFVQLVMHVVDVIAHHSTLTDVQRGTFAVAIILIWVRLMKNFRAFRQVGPFIVICTYMIKDILRWLFVYLIFYIPYCVAFYMIFGGQDIAGYQRFDLVMYTLVRMTLVDDYNYEALEEFNRTMAQILCGSFLAISAIVMLNLFIALMSDTFQRVYDNAIANALLQQASFIQSEEEGLRKKQLNEFRDFIHSNCSPLKEYYDDDWEDTEDDLKKVTIQIKEKMDEYLEQVEDEKREREMEVQDGELPPDMELLYQSLQTLVSADTKKLKKEVVATRKEIAELRQLILTVCTGGGGGVRGIDSSAGVTGGGGSTDRTAGSIEQSAGRRTKRPKSKRDGFSVGETDRINEDAESTQGRRSSRHRVSGVRRLDSKTSKGSTISKSNLISPRRNLEGVDEDEETGDVSPRDFYDKSGETDDDTSAPVIVNEAPPPVYRSKERLGGGTESPTKVKNETVVTAEVSDTSGIPRPRNTVRQIQVLPGDNTQMNELLSRYQTGADLEADMLSESRDPSPRVSVRTRNINTAAIPPSYNSHNSANT
ncbi:uncharacterized protein LOC142342665 isoform X3 [Convolutriloba macropyga]|uniref:uncharacterized protein LOC142342665 isoform X3 n=1 Tax=Convolutriloba macropyga TaxID=536237 RepID=UPI003F51B0F4